MSENTETENVSTENVEKPTLTLLEAFAQEFLDGKTIVIKADRKFNNERQTQRVLEISSSGADIQFTRSLLYNLHENRFAVITQEITALQTSTDDWLFMRTLEEELETFEALVSHSRHYTFDDDSAKNFAILRMFCTNFLYADDPRNDAGGAA